MIRFNVPFVLASRSPRRRILLDGLGLNPEIRPSDVAEDIQPGVPPGVLVERIALDKAVDIAQMVPDGLVLG
ncbi:MAG: septum formation protein Maf, partial [Rhodothermales bacterium]|nr:septum formation protein Maf [Rhodothermales bacterium]